MIHKNSVFKTSTYIDAKKKRGSPWSKFLLENPSKFEIDNWHIKNNKLENIKQILVFLNQNISRAKNRGDNSKIVEVDIDYIYNVGIKQNFICALTGIPLEFKRGGTYWLGKWCNPNSCTIDRIDSKLGYVKNNIQLITWKANCLKQHLNNVEFIEFCKEVAKWNS